MWKLKSLISLTFLIFGLQTHAGDPEDVLTKLMKRRESFRRIILSEKGIDFLKELSTSMTPQCGAAIRRTMATGGQLYSQTMRKAAVTAKDFPYYSGFHKPRLIHEFSSLHLACLGYGPDDRAALIFYMIFLFPHPRHPEPLSERHSNRDVPRRTPIKTTDNTSIDRCHKH